MKKLLATSIAALLSLSVAGYAAAQETAVEHSQKPAHHHTKDAKQKQNAEHKKVEGKKGHKEGAKHEGKKTHHKKAGEHTKKHEEVKQDNNAAQAN